MATTHNPPDHIAEPANETMALVADKWRRLNIRNEHWMAVIVGREGSGKSYTAIKIAELMDDSFSAEKVFFHPSNVLEKLRDEEYSAGDVWVLDEAGAGIGRRSWQDSGQKKLNQALQLVRSHNVGFVFTLPRLSELDSQTQGRLQTAIEIVNKNEDRGYVQGPWFDANVERMDMGSHSTSIWWNKPKIGGREVGAVSFAPPSESIVSAYEETKTEFQRSFYDEAIAELRDEAVDDEDDDELTEPAEIAADIIDNGVDQFIRDINGGTQTIIDKDAIAVEYEIGSRKIKQVKAALKRQGDIGDDIL
jgi:hypothetical protein